MGSFLDKDRLVYGEKIFASKACHAARKACVQTNPANRHARARGIRLGHCQLSRLIVL
jgi:hypothetical protein